MDEYTVVINSIAHTVQATAEDAKTRSLEPKAAQAPVNKARKPRNRAAASDRTDDA